MKLQKSLNTMSKAEPTEDCNTSFKKCLPFQWDAQCSDSCKTVGYRLKDITKKIKKTVNDEENEEDMAKVKKKRLKREKEKRDMIRNRKRQIVLIVCYV